MVLSTAHAHGVLFQRAVARVGLAGVQDGRVSFGDRVHKGAGERGDARELLQKVERGPLRGQHPPSWPSHLGHQIAWLNPRPIPNVRSEAQVGIHPREDRLCHRQASNDARALGDDAPV